MLASGAKSFYQAANEGGQPRTRYFDLAGSGYQTLEDTARHSGARRR